MKRLSSIYFDGKSYAEYCAANNVECTESELKAAAQFDFAPISSISFENYSRNTFCDITIDGYEFIGISVKHLFTDLSRDTKKHNILYPSHNPTPDPGALY